MEIEMSLRATRQLAAIVLMLLPLGAAIAKDECKLDDVKLEGDFPHDLEGRAELSGAARFGDLVLLVSNEVTGREKNQNSLQLFERKGKKTFTWIGDKPIPLPGKDACTDADLEGIAVLGDRAYVVGSHSLARPKVRPKASYDSNKAQLDAGKLDDPPCDKRSTLLELQLSATGEILSSKPIDLAGVLARHPVFAPFRKVPSKENGIDIEGIAVTEHKIYIGFRGPVLRDNFVPVLVLDRAQPDTGSEIRYLQLDGRGIRDMARVKDGFLIIAGPVGDAKLSFQLYFWNGADTGSNPPSVGKVKPLCKLPPNAAKPEGLAVMSETSAGLRDSRRLRRQG
jgi:Protein of unknown function (DUF3616)